MGLTEYLANMQLLLGSETFGRWPLDVRFFAKDVYDNWTKKAPGFKQSPGHKLSMPRPGITFSLDPSFATTNPQKPGEIEKKPMKERMDIFEAWDTTKALYGLDVGYQPYEEAFSKSSNDLKQDDHIPQCAVCRQLLEPATDLILHCSAFACASRSHLACLASRFLNVDGGAEALLPTNGSCPDCHSILAWKDLMMDLSLRQRGQDEIQKLMKGPKAKKSKANAGGGTAAEADEADEDAGAIDEEGPDYDASFAEMGPGVTGSLNASDSESADLSEDELPLPVETKVKGRRPATKKVPIATVADSEWDDIEEIT